MKADGENTPEWMESLAGMSDLAWQVYLFVTSKINTNTITTITAISTTITTITIVLFFL